MTLTACTPGRLREALGTYEQALTFTPGKCSERALIHSNRAACYLKEGKLPETLKQRGAALAAEPGYERALVRRARAYEMAGRLDLALADLDVAVKARARQTFAVCNSSVQQRLRMPIGARISSD